MPRRRETSPTECQWLPCNGVMADSRRGSTCRQYARIRGDPRISHPTTRTTNTAKTIAVATVANEELPQPSVAWLCRVMTTPTPLHPRQASRRIDGMTLARRRRTVTLQALAHAAGHAAVAVALDQSTPSTACPRPEHGAGLPDLLAFRRDLAVLVGGVTAELVAGAGRITPAGARDVAAAIQYAFDAFVLGSYWPDDLPARTPFTPLGNVLAQIIIDRTFAETERAIGTATRILIAGPNTSKGSGRGA